MRSFMTVGLGVDAPRGWSRSKLRDVMRLWPVSCTTRARGTTLGLRGLTSQSLDTPRETHVRCHVSSLSSELGER
jgi:hypothetical protein